MSTKVPVAPNPLVEVVFGLHGKDGQDTLVERLEGSLSQTGFNLHMRTDGAKATFEIRSLTTPVRTFPVPSPAMAAAIRARTPYIPKLFVRMKLAGEAAATKDLSAAPEIMGLLGRISTAGGNATLGVPLGKGLLELKIRPIRTEVRRPARTFQIPARVIAKAVATGFSPRAGALGFCPDAVAELVATDGALGAEKSAQDLGDVIAPVLIRVTPKPRGGL